MSDFQSKLQSVYELMLNPEDFLRASGELFASCDNTWKAALNARDRSTATHIQNFLRAGEAHLRAMKLCGVDNQALSTIVMMLISIDIARADKSSLSPTYQRLVGRLLEEASALNSRAAGDDFALAHTQAILAHASTIFLEEASAMPPHDDAVEGLKKACRACADSENLSRADRLVDIFMHLKAILN